MNQENDARLEIRDALWKAIGEAKVAMAEAQPYDKSRDDLLSWIKAKKKFTSLARQLSEWLSEN